MNDHLQPQPAIRAVEVGDAANATQENALAMSPEGDAGDDMHAQEAETIFFFFFFFYYRNRFKNYK